MSDATGCGGRCCGTSPESYCSRCDLLVGLDGVHVLSVGEVATGLEVVVETVPGPHGCPECGAVGVGHGRDEVRLVDIPAFGRPVTIVWRKRRFVCPGGACERTAFVEYAPQVAWPRHTTTRRCVWWAVEQLRREHATVAGLARQLGTAWRTVWNPVKDVLVELAADESRFDGVRTLGVDEHFGITVLRAGAVRRR